MSRARPARLKVASAAVTRSRVEVRLPKRTRASQRASSRDIPRATFSSMRISMCVSNSASISRLTCERRNKFVMRRKLAMGFLRSSLLFAAQSLHGIDARSTARGNPARRKSDCGNCESDADKHDGIIRTHAAEQVRDQAGEAECEHESSAEPDGGKQRCTAQNHTQNLFALCA